MATWNWPWQRTMRVRGLLIGLTASLRSERLGTTCKRYRMRISGLDRVVLRARFLIRARFIEKSILPDASSSRTIDSQVTAHAALGRAVRVIAKPPRSESLRELPFFHYNKVVCKNVGRACWGAEKF